MNENFADWYREADLEPQHDVLLARWKGVEAVSAELDTGSVQELGRVFYGLTGTGDAHAALCKAMSEVDTAFSAKSTIEIRVLAAASLINIAETRAEPHSQVAAYSGVCPSLLGRRKSLFLPSVPEYANTLLDDASGELRRSRTTNRKPISKLAEEVAKIEEAEGPNSFTAAGPHVRAALEKIHSGLASLSNAVSRLETTQELYREDSDVLWWMTGGYSRDLDIPLKELGLPAAAFVAGKELADLVSIQPGPLAAKAVLSRCLQELGFKSNDRLTLTQAMKKVPTEWKSESFGEEGDRVLLSLCPVTAALYHSATIDGSWGNAAESLTGVEVSTKLNALETAYQLYRECMFRKLLQ